MSKKGIIGVLAIFLVLGVVIFLTVYFFVWDRGEGVTKRSVEIDSGSVFVNKLSGVLSFSFNSDALENEVEGASVTIEGEKGKYVKEFGKTIIYEKSFVINYSGSIEGRAKKIILVLRYTSGEARSEYVIKESDSQSEECNYDGVHDENEECDDGNLDNNDGCLYHCKLPKCGDGALYVGGGEECDWGIRNSDTEAGYCRTDCREARCGDDVIDSGEECDNYNLGEYDDGAEQCEIYDEKYISGDLACYDCKIKTERCVVAIKALKFDGNSTSVDLSRLDIEDEREYTFSMWVKPDEDIDEKSSILDCSNNRVSIYVLDDEIEFKVVSDKNYSEKTARAEWLQNGGWMHVAGVHSETYAKIYLNGKIVDSEAQAGQIYENVTCKIGSNYGRNDDFFKGLIDDFRIYQKALSLKEIERLNGDGQNSESITESLIGWWRFNDGEGKIAKDSSSSEINGFISGDPEWVIENQL